MQLRGPLNLLHPGQAAGGWGGRVMGLRFLQCLEAGGEGEGEEEI